MGWEPKEQCILVTISTIGRDNDEAYRDTVGLTVDISFVAVLETAQDRRLAGSTRIDARRGGGDGGLLSIGHSKNAGNDGSCKTHCEKIKGVGSSTKSIPGQAKQLS